MFKLPEPDGYLSASDVKELAEDLIGYLPLPGVEGSPLDPGDIWAVVIFSCVNETSIWETCKETMVQHESINGCSGHYMPL